VLRRSPFFFSSRRRHTRWPRDWSSDVCSSDLAAPAPAGPPAETTSPADAPLAYRVLADETNQSANTVEFHVLTAADPKHDGIDRSEERRVGKECTTRCERPHILQTI